jgi:CRISPR-associated protein Csd2
MSNPIQKRYDFVYLFDVKDGNPNGDPDAGNMPRIDPETGHGIVTDVCLKRKVRNYVELTKEGKAPFCIYVKEKAVLTNQREPAYKATEGKEGEERVQAAKRWMCANFFDIRTFGAVMAAKENNCGQVRGPVQFNFGRSQDPIVPLEATITRVAVETPREAEAQGGDNRTMGRKHFVPYGLYRAHGFISAALAMQTGFSTDDLDLLWKALVEMFEHDHSAARGLMAARKLIVFEHQDKLGNAPAHALFEKVIVKRKDDSKPPRSFKDDYSVEAPADGAEVVPGVVCRVLL